MNKPLTILILGCFTRSWLCLMQIVLLIRQDYDQARMCPATPGQVRHCKAVG